MGTHKEVTCSTEINRWIFVVNTTYLRIMECDRCLFVSWDLSYNTTVEMTGSKLEDLFHVGCDSNYLANVHRICVCVAGERMFIT